MTDVTGKRKRRSGFSRFFTMLTVGIALMPVLFPNAFWHILMLADFLLSPTWRIFDDPYVQRYHAWLVSRLPDRTPGTPVILPLEGTTFETLRAASMDFSIPVVIRGAVKDVPAIKLWGNKTWWVENYGDEEVMCKDVVYGVKKGEDNKCTIRSALGFPIDGSVSERTYVTGDTKIFLRRPELQTMVDSPFLESLAPGKRVFTQLFMGYDGMGSDIHSAIGTNFFRQIAGRKKWWFMPPSQTAYVYASLNPNGYSAHTKTFVGKRLGAPESAWFKKLERYTVTLEPGDFLLNSAWYWHGIININDDPNGLVIGTPTRYAQRDIWAGLKQLKTNWFLTFVALAAIQKQYGLGFFKESPSSFQEGIERARKARFVDTDDTPKNFMELRDE